MLPSEYVDRNCFTGLANIKRRELGMRYEIGIDNMLWGTDFPHPEGTWPNTHEWLQKTFFDIPIDETRRMLGLAARPRRSASTSPSCSRSPTRSAPRRPTSASSARDATAADLEARWAPVKEVGRHWLTGHDFSIYPI